MREKKAILALDVGERRIGVALANPIAKIANPLTTLAHDDKIFEALKDLISHNEVGMLVVGLPRGLDGQETKQTESIRQFSQELQEHLGLVPMFQDETLTSVQAEEKLQQSKKVYTKEDIDMYAAAHILQDYLDTSLVKDSL